VLLTNFIEEFVREHCDINEYAYCDQPYFLNAVFLSYLEDRLDPDAYKNVYLKYMAASCDICEMQLYYLLRCIDRMVRMVRMDKKEEKDSGITLYYKYWPNRKLLSYDGMLAFHRKNPQNTLVGIQGVALKSIPIFTKKHRTT
jgi:hypothetical protein